MKKILYVIAGALILLLSGFIYAWSILAVPISMEFPHWGAGELSVTFTLCMSFFCLGGLAAGLISRRRPPRLNIALGAALLCAGFLISSRAQTLGTLYLSYGVLCGLGSGFSYNAVISMIPPWFPEKQGLVSGILLMGFGSSSLIIGTVFSSLVEKGVSWRQFFAVAGPLMGAVLLLGALFLDAPQKTRAQSGESDIDLSPGQMLKTGGFWLFFIWAVFLLASGLGIISQGQAVARYVSPAMGASGISLLVGLISVFNGIGRVIAGAVFDSRGSRSVMRLINLSFLLVPLLLALACLVKSALIVAACFILLGMAYGGIPTMSAAYVKKAFGQKSYSVNYPLMNLNLLVASFGGALAGMLYDGFGSFYPLSVVILIFAGISFVIQLNPRISG